MADLATIAAQSAAYSTARDAIEDYMMLYGVGSETAMDTALEVLDSGRVDDEIEKVRSGT